MFEVALCLAMLMFPISVACRRFLGVGDEGIDAFLAAVVLVPVGFVFEADPLHLPPASGPSCSSPMWHRTCFHT